MLLALYDLLALQTCPKDIKVTGKIPTDLLRNICCHNCTVVKQRIISMSELLISLHHMLFATRKNNTACTANTSNIFTNLVLLCTSSHPCQTKYILLSLWTTWHHYYKRNRDVIYSPADSWQINYIHKNLTANNGAKLCQIVHFHRK